MAENKYFYTYAGTLEAFQASAHPATYKTFGLVLIENGGKPVLYSGGKYIKSAENADNKFFNGISINGTKYDLTLPDHIKFVDGLNTAVELKDGSAVAINVNLSAYAKTADVAATYATKVELQAVDTKVGELDTYVGDIPEGATATDIVGYIQEKTAGIATEGAMTELSNRITTIEGDYLKEADKTELSEAISNAEQDAVDSAKSYTDGKITELTNGAIANNTAAIAKLNGGSDVDGSVDNKIKVAIDAVVNGADDAFDTLKEIAEWIADDETGTAAMSSAITANSNAITEIKGKAVTGFDIVEYYDDHIELIPQINEVSDETKAITITLVSTTDTSTDAGLMSNQMYKDLYATKAIADGVATTYATKTEVTTAQSAADAAQGTADEAKHTAQQALDELDFKANSADVYTKEQTYTQAAVDEMFTFGVLE